MHNPHIRHPLCGQSTQPHLIPSMSTLRSCNEGEGQQQMWVHRGQPHLLQYVLFGWRFRLILGVGGLKRASRAWFSAEFLFPVALIGPTGFSFSGIRRWAQRY